MNRYAAIQEQLLQQQYTWLITGAAGFIGSHLVATLLSLNQKVIGLDNFITGRRENIEDVLTQIPSTQANDFSSLEYDICNFTHCMQATEGVDFVLHQAALGSVPRSIEAPHITNDINVNGFVNMLTAAKDNRVRRFVYASSSSVHGDSATLPKLEAQVGNPLSPYAVSKYANELYAQSFAHCYPLDCIGLRYFNVFGPRQNPSGPYAAVIPRWIKAFLADETIYIFGDGTNSRDFCYIDNVVQANLLAALVENQHAVNQIYNVTVGKATTLNQLFAFMRQIFALDKEPIHREFRAGDIRQSLADISKAKDLLGYVPSRSLEEGLTATVAWFAERNTLQRKH